MSQQQSALYLTSDLALATTLSLHFPIEDIDRTNPRKAFFVFKRSEKLEEIVKAFFSNEIKIAPQVFFNQLRDVKVRLYAERRVW